MPGLAQLPEVPAGVLVHRHGQVDPAVVILFNRLDGRGLPGQRQVEDVGSAAGTEPDTVAPPDLRRADVDAFQPPPVGLGVPVSNYPRTRKPPSI